MASTIEKTAPLAPVLSERYALKWQHTVFCGFFALLFLMLSHAPMHLVGPWKSIRLGAAGWATNAFGFDDPTVPLANGMNHPQLSWLTSGLLSATQSRFGDEGVAQLIAMILFAAYLVWARCFFLLGRSILVAAVAVAILFATTNWHFGDGGPSTFGFLCSALLAWMLLPALMMRVRARESNAIDEMHQHSELGTPHLWWCIPTIMVLWANLSGTFVIGILMLLAVAVDCAFESVRANGKAAFWKNRRFQHSVYLLEIAILVTCLNPLGIKIWSSLFTLTHNPFWIAAGGAATIELRSLLGVQLFLAAAITLWVFRTSRLRICSADVVVVTGLLLAAVGNARLIAWIVPMFLLFVVPHVVFGRGVKKTTDTVEDETASPAPTGEHRPLQFAHSLICLLLVWMAFAFSPLSTPILGGQTRAIHRLYRDTVPWGVSNYLAENNSAGLMWAPSYWSDWIAWHSDRNAALYTSSNVAALPGQAQRDYERVYVGDASWQRTLDRYNVQTIVIDKKEQERLFNVVLREATSWRIVFESEKAIVLRRLEA